MCYRCQKTGQNARNCIEQLNRSPPVEPKTNSIVKRRAETIPCLGTDIKHIVFEGQVENKTGKMLIHTVAGVLIVKSGISSAEIEPSEVLTKRITGYLLVINKQEFNT